MKKKTIITKKKKFSTSGNLFFLIEDIKSAGYSEEDLKDFEFTLSYGSCYYEGDSPDIICEYTK
jgi:hypothetical protein